MNSTWFYILSDPGLWTVGFEDQSGKWHTDSDHDAKDDAVNRVAFLNGGGGKDNLFTKLELASLMIAQGFTANPNFTNLPPESIAELSKAWAKAVLEQANL